MAETPETSGFVNYGEGAFAPPNPLPAANMSEPQVPTLGNPPALEGTPPIVPPPGGGTGPQLPPRPIGTSGAGQPPKSKAEFFRNMLGQFFYSVGTGLANRGSGPDADARGAGAAMTALPNLRIQQEQLGISREQAESAKRYKEAQAQSLTPSIRMIGPDGQEVMVPPAHVGQALASQYRLAGQVKAAETRAEGQKTAATIGAGARVEAAKIGQGIPVDVPQELQEQFGAPAKLPLKQLNALESAANKPLTTVQGATDSYLLNKQTGGKTALGVGSGRMAATMARPVQVADPDNPGGVKYMPAGEAMRTGAQAASSASVTAPKSVIKDFTSGQSAKTLNSFNTATEHLKLLSQLGDALDNGATPIINRLGNQYATATGGPAPTSFDMAKQAVAGEIAKTFKGQATEGEISAINSTLNNAQSPAQLKGAIGTALSLMESKRAALMEQYDKGLKASPAFPKGKGALSEGEARTYLQKAGGDANKARALAKKDGRSF